MSKDLELSKGGANHQKPRADDDVMTAGDGTDRVRGQVRAGHSCSKTRSREKRSSILTTNAYPSAWCTPVDMVFTAISS